MSREHIVETLEWQVGFANEHEAFEWQPRLASMIRGSAVDVIAEVFDELGGSHEVVAIDALELDLGVLPRTDFEAQMKSRLRECLRDALSQELGAARVQEAANQEASAKTPVNRTDVLRDYLARGFLSWRAGEGTRRRLDVLAEEHAREHGADLNAWMRDSPPGAKTRLAALLHRRTQQMRRRIEAALIADGPVAGDARTAWSQLLMLDTPWFLERVGYHGQSAQVRRHLARHFGDSLLLDLVGAIVPTERDFIEATMARAQLFGDAMTPPVHASQMHMRLWEFTLGYLLVERGSDFNRRSYIASLLRRGAQQGGIEYTDLVRALARSLANAGASGPMQRQMLDLLDALASDAGVQEMLRMGDDADSKLLIEAYDSGHDEAASEQAWLRLRVSALMAGGASADDDSRAAWSQLLSADAGWLTTEISREGQGAQVRRNIAHGFNETMLLELTDLFVPSQRDFIEAVTREPALIGRAMNPPVEEARMRPRLWEFTLAYLLAERGSDFNRRSYIASLLRQAVGRNEAAYAQLLQTLRDNIGPSPAGAMQREMLRLIDALRLAAVAPANVEASESRHAEGSREWREIDLPRLRFDWQAALAAPTLNESMVLASWRALANHDAAWLLDATCRHAQSAQARRQLARDLPEPLLVEWLELMTPGAGVFVEAVVSHSAKLAPPGTEGGARSRLWEFSLEWLLAERGSEFNRRSYMEAVLERMARDEGVDARELLAALAASLQASPLAGALQRQMLQLTRSLLDHFDESQSSPRDDHHGLEQLAALVSNEGRAPSPSAADWALQAERWFDSPAPRARAALEAAIRVTKACARLIRLLPPRLLTRVIFALRRHEHAQLQLCADLLVASFAEASPGAGRTRLEALKWQFIFEYLFVQGRAFSVADFARRMTDWFAAQLRPPKPARWREVVARGVARSSKTAGHAVGRTMARSIASKNVAGRGVAGQSVTGQSEAPPSPTSGPAFVPARKQATSDSSEPPEDEPIYVANAGMVLAEPFLTHLFRMRGLVAENGFIDPGAASKAACLLQVFVFGAKESQEPQLEHELVLNKLLCGIALADPLAWNGVLDADDIAGAQSLLQAMLQQWKALGGTTPQGLRETFLQREGRLVRKPDHWLLLVQPGPYDMLVDQLPWGFSTIRYPWMERMIHVQWR